MTISYNWLSEYLPQKVAPEELSKILTAIGLEVENMEVYESVKGSLKGLVAGEILTCIPHPNADKLKLTTVNTGAGEPSQIVCGAPNVAAGQKVIVATVGTTIYPAAGEPLTMKIATIRGVESYGMICAEDEIGLGTGHAGIIVLPEAVKPGTPAAEYFDSYADIIMEIGLTPNRMDAMSHLGVAKDVCAYLSYHQHKEIKPLLPFADTFSTGNHDLPITVTIENEYACRRYSGVSISNIRVKSSPAWLQNRLKAIGVRPINNIVDITNFVLHETGQPLHAFDADAIIGNAVIVKNLPQGTTFLTLDGKERKLNAADLMICNAEAGMCIAGVFGGAESGVKESTTAVFLESAWFNPENIRKTSLAHDLRTDAAAHFEKGVDISATADVLKRTAVLIKELAGGEISSDIIDIYPQPQQKRVIVLKYNYLQKLSGKHYTSGEVKSLLLALGFEIIKETADALTVAVPFSKLDISLPADVVEEILRIDGIDNIAIPVAITISPAQETLGNKEALKNKLAGQLTGLGFFEIMTNSITNSKYFSPQVLDGTVKMMNSLSEALDVLRPSMLQTGLETIVYNSNRKNSSLRFFEFGKTYHTNGIGNYTEAEHVCLYITGSPAEQEWKVKLMPLGFFDIKGYAAAVLQAAGINNIRFEESNEAENVSLNIISGNKILGNICTVATDQLKQFDIKQPVYFADIYFDVLLSLVEAKAIIYTEIPRFPAVQRDLSLIIDKAISYGKVEATIYKKNLPKLTGMRLFDVFESEKLGDNLKSLAISFTFSDDEKTLTDKETDNMMNTITQGLEKELNAVIRKG